MNKSRTVRIPLELIWLVDAYKKKHNLKTSTQAARMIAHHAKSTIMEKKPVKRKRRK